MPEHSMSHLLLMAFMIGLGSSSHCLMMCGGISAALSANIKTGSASTKMLKLLSFHSGRIACYSLLGVFSGSVIQLMSTLVQGPMLLAQGIFYSRLLAGILLISIGLYVAGFSKNLRYIEQLFSGLWKTVQPLTKNVIQMQRWHHGLALGFLWGFLPCGIIYSTLIWATASAPSAQAGVLMLAFGSGTLPAMLLANVGNLQLTQWLRQTSTKRLFGMMMVLYGIWTLVSLVWMPMGGDPDGMFLNHSMMHGG